MPRLQTKIVEMLSFFKMRENFFSTVNFCAKAVGQTSLVVAIPRNIKLLYHLTFTQMTFIELYCDYLVLYTMVVFKLSHGKLVSWSVRVCRLISKHICDIYKRRKSIRFLRHKFCLCQEGRGYWTVNFTGVTAVQQRYLIRWPKIFFII